VSKPITEEEFRLIKSKLDELRYERLTQAERKARVVGFMVGRSEAKVSIIESCETFDDYKRISKAEHPPVRNSLAARVKELERRMDAHDEAHEREKTQQLSLLYNERPERV
jgi:hypothetical protein